MNVFRHIKAIVSILFVTGVQSCTPEKYDLETVKRLLEAGDYSKVQQIMDEMEDDEVNEEVQKEFEVTASKMKRIQLDFSKTEEDIHRKLAPHFPDLTANQLQRWENDGKLEMRIIDGTKKYFRNAVPNFFRLDSAAQKIMAEKEGEPVDPLKENKAGIENPYEKVKTIYYWIDNNIRWTSALEYSTFDCIPAYTLEIRRGDCGMQTLLFMSLARFSGIPCKWQSGWMLHPGQVNLHDWCEVFYEGFGWLPLDQSSELQRSENKAVKEFYFTGIDAYRLIINDDYGRELYPPKKYFRSEPIDFQRGEVEWKNGNIYFDKWYYQMNVRYLNNVTE